MRARILSAYDDFVGEVATARGLPEARVRELAEGRVWMGEDALARDLVDGTGTLADVLEDARTRAGLDADEEFVIEEYPPRSLFRLPRLVPDAPGLSLGADWPEDTFLSLRLLMARPGEPCRLLPPEQLPAEWLPAR